MVREAIKPQRETTPDEWQRVREILANALELGSAERATYLESACSGDTKLRARLDELIAAHETTSAARLDIPAFSVTSSNSAPAETLCSLIGRRIGNYRIEAEIAQGGMGAVFRAIRADDEFKKQVAIKLVRGAAFSKYAAQLFRHERQVLATLEHPNIARLLDGGTTEEGTPYLVMEYVEGQPVTSFCEAHRFSVDDRLKLFQKVCAAVHYAHQNLVIHRDIKPANILVTEAGEPKLLDFGIAKIVHLDERESATVTSWRALTPAYASPEQISGDPISTATDIYSLGLVLRELLTGVQAFSPEHNSPLRLQRAALEEDPELPSRAVLRGPIPNREQIVHQLRGDLDSIVGKAIRKNRFERYSSVEQLADDIRRHLEHLPVAAQPDTWPYRAAKFVRRHSTAVVAGALIFGLLIAGIALTTYEARVARAERLRAEHRFNDVRKLANSLMFDVHDSIQNLPGATPARKVLVDRALEYLDSLAREVGNDPSLLQELASAYEKVADVQGNPSAANLGDSGGAVANFRKALALREHLARLDPKSESNQKKLAKDYQRIGLAQEASTENKSALESFQKAFAIHERLAQSDPNPELQEELGGDYFLLGHCYGSLAQPNAALEIYRKAAATLEAIPNPSAPVQSRLAATYSFTAGILQLQNQLAPAIVFQRKSLNLMKTISSANPGNARNREFLGEAYYWLGFFYERAIDTPKALEAYRSAADIVTPLSIADPKEARTKHYVALCDHSIGSILVHRGNAAEGLDRLNKSLQIYQDLSAADTAGTSTQLSFIADAHATLASAYAYLGAQHRLPTEKRIAYWKQAQSEYRRSLDEWLQIKKRGVLSAFEIHETEDIAAELDKCDAALARLHARSY